MIDRFRLRRLALASATFLSLAPVSAVWAQTPVASAAPEADAADADDGIIVIADKREVGLQKAPVAVSAIAGSSLDRQRIITALDLNGQIPSLSVTQTESFQRLVSIRGVGHSTPQNLIAQPGVAFHIDGVYVVGSSALTQDFFDVGRLDILRGPQGTVYGQNAVGGTINVITNRPNFDGISGHADVAYGNYNYFNPRIALNVPLSDKIAVRVTAARTQHDGYTKSVLLNRFELEDAKQTSFRGQILFEPSDDFRLILSSQYVHANQADNALKNILDPEPDPRRVTQDYEGRFRFKQFIQSLTLEKDFDWGSASSITSYQYLKYFKSHDNDRLSFAFYTPHDIMPYSHQKVRSWTQEFNVKSNSGGTFEWILGAFGLRTNGDSFVLEYYTRPGQPMPIIFERPATGNPANLGYQAASTPSRRSYSGYGQVTAHLADTVRLTGGLRYTKDKSFSNNSSYFGAITRVSRKGDILTGKLGVDVDITDRNLFYATITRGFKPAGSNLSTRPVLGSLTFKAEKVWAYEAGTKNRFFDDQVTLNTAAFYYDYTDYQFSQDDPIPFQGGISNVPKARIYGAESELTVKLPAGFVFDSHASYLRGKVRSDYLALDTTDANAVNRQFAAIGLGSFAPQTIAARLAAAQNINGNRLPFLSKYSFKVGLTKSVETGYGPLTVGVDYRYQSGFDSRIFNDPALDRVGGYGLLNGSIGLKTSDGKWSFDIIGTNLTNSNAEATRYTNTFGFGTTAISYVAPRQVLGRVGYTF